MEPPRCWWCHEPIDLDSRYRGEEPAVIALPVGVVICTPACPARPAGARVWRTGWAA